MAYCLLGLFHLNLTLLYGEGDKAFMRLQRKIIKQYDDESIFACFGDREHTGMLATSPAAFVNSGAVVALNIPPEQRLQYRISNKGLELKIPRTVSPPTISILRKLNLWNGTLSSRSIDVDDPHTSHTTSSHTKANLEKPFEIELHANPHSDPVTHHHSKYSMKIPDDKKHRRYFQLACGFATERSPDGKLVTDPVKVASRQVVVITLHRTEAGWRRVQCEGGMVQMWKEFTQKDPTEHTLFYVEQDRL